MKQQKHPRTFPGGRVLTKVKTLKNKVAAKVLIKKQITKVKSKKIKS